MNQVVPTSSDPPNDAYLQMIGSALDAALIRARQPENQANIDVAQARYVIFSDLHKGARNRADDFRVSEQTYHAALAYYFEMGYTLIVLGDVEELWEEQASAVLPAYAHTIEFEARFHQCGRYLRFWGNHDDDWSYPDAVKRHLSPLYGNPPLNVRECLNLKVTDGAQAFGSILLLHGHQGTLESDRFAGLSKLFVRYGWRNFQRLTNISLNTPAKNWEIRERHNRALYTWAEKQNKLILVAGHTHRPVFKSRSHPTKIREELLIAREAYRQTGAPALQEKAALLAAELEWVLSQEQQRPGQEGLLAMLKPCYFNTGCCSFLDGDITGLEIADGEFYLVRWPDDAGNPQRCVLESAGIKDVFAAC